MSAERTESLAQIAAWYYEQGLDQGVIARRINRSRSMVSRLLQEARAEGLVEIRVHHPLKTHAVLEDRLLEWFGPMGLQAVRVLAEPPEDYATCLRRLGQLGARFLREWLDDGVTVGVGWGTAVHQVVHALPELRLRDATVVQLIGAIGRGDPLIDGPELARWLAQKLHASHRLIPAPLIVETEDIARALLNELAVADALNIGRTCDVALVGIGSAALGWSSLYRAGYIDDAEMAQLLEAGVVGDILARQLDELGAVADTPLNHRVIGLDLADLAKVPMVVGVAGGEAKAPAVRAVLRGGHVKALITDAAVAARVLDDP